MSPVKVNGRPDMLMSHMCVKMTCRPSAKITFSGHVVRHLFSTCVPSMMNSCVTPESAMALMVSFVLVQIVAPANAGF